MEYRPTILKNEDFFSSAGSVVRPGYFRKFVNEYPVFLQEDDPQRQPSSNTCKMLVATAWQEGQIGDITPQGKTYFVFTYQDHKHPGGEPHFNKTVQVYTHNTKDSPIRLTLEKGVDDHYIKATALGTSLAYLEQPYRIPHNDNGPISDLLDSETSVGPYPTD